jgi:hypothetical protein
MPNTALYRSPCRRRVGGGARGLATGCSKPADQGRASTASAPSANASTVSQAKPLPSWAT